MKNVNFLMKLLSLVIILVCLGRYQNIAAARAEAVAERESEIAEIETYNKEILLAQSSESEDTSSYQDGIYEGTGTGFGGDIVVSVTIANGSISQIDVVSAKDEDETYFAQASQVLDTMISAGSADVDTVSGATFSSGGLIEAVGNALNEAEGK